MDCLWLRRSPYYKGRRSFPGPPDEGFWRIDLIIARSLFTSWYITCPAASPVIKDDEYVAGHAHHMRLVTIIPLVSIITPILRSLLSALRHMAAEELLEDFVEFVAVPGPGWTLP